MVPPVRFARVDERQLQTLYLFSLATRELFNVLRQIFIKRASSPPSTLRTQAGGSARTFGVVGAHLSTLSALPVSLSLFLPALLSFGSSRLPPTPGRFFSPSTPLIFHSSSSLLVASDRSSSADTRKKCAANDGVREPERERRENGKGRKGPREPVRYMQRKTEGERDPCACSRALAR